MKQAVAAVIVLVGAGMGPTMARQAPTGRGVSLTELAWADAEAWLSSPSVVVVLPLGAGALEQGMHMKLNSDERLARHLTSRVQAVSTVVVAPALNYHAYPAFVEYPGSTSLSEGVARDLTVEAVRSLAGSGARRFYVLNTSAATIGTLQAAAKTLADAGLLLGYTDPDYWTKRNAVVRQTNISVSHADEIATSMMLFVDPAAVDMTRAAREYPAGRGVLTRQEGGRGVVSKSGVLGDATLATPEKGRVLVDALLAGILDDIDRVRSAPLPAAKTTAPAPPPSPAPAASRPAAREEARNQNGCTGGEDRAIRDMGSRFSYNWSQLDAQAIAAMFTRMGDIRHPDGTIERGREVIQANRTDLFMHREYHGSKHPLQLMDVRCLPGGNAIADGKWELRLQEDLKSAPGRGLGSDRINAGFCTLILVKSGETGAWSIEAWRYTVNPPAGAPQPTLLSKPGYIGRGANP